MNFIHHSKVQMFETSNFTLPPVGNSSPRVKNLSGFAKVLVDGKVVGVDQSKTFQERMIGRVCSGHHKSSKQKNQGFALLESVSANLEAGMRLLDKQELSLAKIGGKLSEIALALNQARQSAEKQPESQERFILARDDLRG